MKADSGTFAESPQKRQNRRLTPKKARGAKLHSHGHFIKFARRCQQAGSGGKGGGAKVFDLAMAGNSCYNQQRKTKMRQLAGAATPASLRRCAFTYTTAQGPHRMGYYTTFRPSTQGAGFAVLFPCLCA
jgi:hypothetical protein